MVWQTEIPTVGGYYWIAHQNRDTWLDASIEVAYLLDWPQDPYEVPG